MAWYDAVFWRCVAFGIGSFLILVIWNATSNDLGE